MSNLFSPLKLPSGVILQNRICKAAMEEDLADYGALPGTDLCNLYQFWADGHPGLIITGNVMVVPDAMHGPGGVYLGRETLSHVDSVERFKTWSDAAKSGGAACFMQLSHPGRQVFKTLKTEVVSASATRIQVQGPANKMFGTAKALSNDKIENLIQKFAETAIAAEHCGFDGVQIHAAHGYLISQFLSSNSNFRTDKWGGSLENRARFLLEIIRRIRESTSETFGLAVKLNSSDFQKGGFDETEALQVVKYMNKEAVDFVELSGGSYESAAMFGAGEQDNKSSTYLREVYFLEFARQIEAVAKMPLMVTGGITRKSTAETALGSGAVEIIGIARAMGHNPYLPKDWHAGKNETTDLTLSKSRHKPFRAMSDLATTKANLYDMAKGKFPKKRNVLASILRHQFKLLRKTKDYKKWLSDLGL